MATKHDRNRAHANLWVTQQNLARAKGARPYQAKSRKAVVIAPADVTSSPANATEAAPPAAPSTEKRED